MHKRGRHTSAAFRLHAKFAFNDDYPLTPPFISHYQQSLYMMKCICRCHLQCFPHSFFHYFLYLQSQNCCENWVRDLCDLNGTNNCAYIQVLEGQRKCTVLHAKCAQNYTIFHFLIFTTIIIHHPSFISYSQIACFTNPHHDY